MNNEIIKLLILFIPITYQSRKYEKQYAFISNNYAQNSPTRPTQSINKKDNYRLIDFCVQTNTSSTCDVIN